MIESMLRDNMMLHVMQEPLWLQAWVGWMMLVNTASLLFLKQRAARWVLAAWIGNIITMSVLYEMAGYVRLLGLSHVIWWTPLAIYLWRQRVQFAVANAYGYWGRVLLATIVASLIIDYIDVIRYFMGDGALS
jgi:hypothetical protein